MTPLEITGNRRTTRNLEGAIDRFDRRGMVEWPLTGDEHSQRSTPENKRRGGDLFGVGGIDFGGQCIEVVVFVAQDVSLAIEHWRDVSSTDIAQQRQHLMTHPVANKRRIVVRRIIDDRDPQRFAQLAGFGSPQRDDRVAAGIA